MARKKIATATADAIKPRLRVIGARLSPPGRRSRGTRLPRVVAIVALVSLAGAGLARAEITQKGTLQVTVGAKLSPTRLPRTGVAPIAVSVGGQFATTDHTTAPQLKTMRIELNRHGDLDTEGLPSCRRGKIQPASTARALRACRPALVGEGSFSVDVVLGGQEPYPTKGRLLIFNGIYKGQPALLGQIYSAHPFANSFVIPFELGQSKRGRYGIALTARLPRAFTNWGHVTGLQMRLSRRYSYRGHRHSFISAGCPAPEGFSGASFPLARTTFTFAGGKTVSETLTRDCTVRG